MTLLLHHNHDSMRQLRDLPRSTSSVDQPPHFECNNVEGVSPAATDSTAFTYDVYVQSLLFLPAPDLLWAVRLLDSSFAKIVVQPSFWEWYNPGKWHLASGITRAAWEADKWIVSDLPPVFMWAPSPLLILRPGTLPPIISCPRKSLRDGGTSLFLTIPVSFTFIEKSLERTMRFAHSRIVGPRGSWVEVQYVSEDAPAHGQFFAMLRMSKGTCCRDELLSEPLVDWDDLEDPGACVYHLGYGRNEWEGPPVISISALIKLAKWLDVKVGDENMLWLALMQASWGRELADHMPHVRASCGSDLAEKATIALQHVALHRSKASLRPQKEAERPLPA